MPVTSRRRFRRLTAPGGGPCPRRVRAATAVLIAILTPVAVAAAAETPGTIQLDKDPLAVVAGPLATGPEGDVWFTSGSKSEIGRVSTAGAFSGFSSGFPAATLPYFITRGADGNMWFTDSHNRSIDRITPSGTVTPFSAGLNSEAFPSVPTEGPGGDIWFTDSGALKAIGQITPKGAISEHTAGLRAHASLVDLTEGPDGNIWFTDNGEENVNDPAIGKLTPGGAYTEYSEGLRTDSNLGEIVAGPDGNLWALDGGTGNSILKITPAGAITEYTEGLPANGFPEAITAGADGNMWVTYDENSGEHGYILRVTPAGVITPFPFPLPNERPFQSAQIAAGADGRVWVAGVAEYEPEKVGSYLGAVATGPPAGQLAPTISGAGEPGAAEHCEGGSWPQWNGSAPSLSAFSFDGYSWLLNGSPIVGAHSQDYTPTAAQAGQQLSCRATATYPIPSVTEVSDSLTVKLGGETPPPPPVLSGIASIYPQFVESAKPAECWDNGKLTLNVETQWLLDGKPIPGATATTYAPPRPDDGHVLSCKLSGSEPGGQAWRLASSGHTVYEQPPLVSVEASGAGACRAGVCLENEDNLATPYLHKGTWTSATPAVCSSGAWTSAAGDSLFPEIRGLAEAHIIRVTLELGTPEEAKTVLLNLELDKLQTARDEATYKAASGYIQVSYGSEPFTAEEVAARGYPAAAIGKPNFFAAGQGAIFYNIKSRTFSVLYNLTAADLGKRLRCVIDTLDGPGAFVEQGDNQSSVRAEADVSSKPICAPQPIAPGSDPQPAYLPGTLTSECLTEAGGIKGATPFFAIRTLPVVGGLADVAFNCTLPSGCNGSLTLTGRAGKAALARTSSPHQAQLARLQIRLRRGARQLFKLRLDASARRLLERAGSKGLSATLTLTVAKHRHNLANLQLVDRGHR